MPILPSRLRLSRLLPKSDQFSLAGLILAMLAFFLLDGCGTTPKSVSAPEQASPGEVAPEANRPAASSPPGDAAGPSSADVGEVSREKARQALDQLLGDAKAANALNELGEEISEATLAYNNMDYAQAMAIIMRVREKLEAKD